MCLYSNSQVFFKPYLFEALPVWIQKCFIHLPWVSLNTPPPPALLGLFLELPSVFKVTKGGCGGCQDINLVTCVPFVFLLYARW